MKQHITPQQLSQLSNIRRKMKSKSITKDILKYTAVSNWVQLKDYEIDMCTIYDETLGFNVNLMVAGDKAALQFFKDKYNEETSIDNKNGSYLKVKDEEGVLWHYIQIKEYDFTFEDINIIAHEVHHFIHNATEEDGVDYGLGGEEIFGSLQGYFTEMVFRALDTRKQVFSKRNKKVRKK